MFARTPSTSGPTRPALAGPRRSTGSRLTQAALVLCVALTGVLVAPDAQAADSLRKSRQATANIRFNMSREHQRADIAKVARRSDVIGWQEINRRCQVKAIDRRSQYNTYWPGGRDERGRPRLTAQNTSPISYRPRKWQHLRSGSVRAVPAINEVSRDRYVNWVLLRDRKTGRVVARWNTHFVPGGWAREKLPHTRKRRRAWFQQRAVVLATIGHLREKARFVIGGADVNRFRLDFLGDAVAYDTDGAHFDYLTHVRRRRMRQVPVKVVELHSDHDAMIGTYPY
ncbi:hypothetical protein [Nocardioides mesophilus]|uniref:Endonuclease/exonuclease/phosphatase family protein n=1 Tax=Nocardioides mesophilus TaxID=433659 RepID=A0A7G9RAT8_9ACTN|nr:hypothetical protein [Nocardioides mesophilus]QNN52713.1 hypothetical protein H9L09_20110 [Nocardioides mesophilus]